MVATADVFVVAIANVWVVDPAAMVIDEGTLMADVLLVSATPTPPVGAATESVTVPVTVVAPVTAPAERVSPVNAAVVLVAVAGLVQRTPLNAASRTRRRTVRCEGEALLGTMVHRAQTLRPAFEKSVTNSWHARRR